jgi:hypothetical protein
MNKNRARGTWLFIEYSVPQLPARERKQSRFAQSDSRLSAPHSSAVTTRFAMM